MKKFFYKIICTSLISFYFFEVEKVKSVVPYYYFPKFENLQNRSLSIGKKAYQLLYFGQYKQSLNLAQLAVKTNNLDLLHQFLLSSNRKSSSINSLLLFPNNKKFKKGKFIYWQKCVSTFIFWSVQRKP